MRGDQQSWRTVAQHVRKLPGTHRRIGGHKDRAEPATGHCDLDHGRPVVEVGDDARAANHSHCCKTRRQAPAAVLQLLITDVDAAMTQRLPRACTRGRRIQQLVPQRHQTRSLVGSAVVHDGSASVFLKRLRTQ